MAKEPSKNGKAGSTADIKNDFSRQARPDVNHGGSDTDLPMGVVDTARNEIENRANLERNLDRHEELWKRERNKIAHSSDPYPDFDLGSRGHRNIQRELQERRTIWEQRKDQIENSFAVRQSDIRQDGNTLSDEFTARKGVALDATPLLRVSVPSEDNPSKPEAFPVERKDEKSISLRDEFPVRSLSDSPQNRR